MTKTCVIIAATPSDVEAEGISRDVAESGDLLLVGERVFDFDQIGVAMAIVPRGQPCVLVLVGKNEQLRILEAIWLEQVPHLLVVCAEVPGLMIRFAFYDPDMRMVLESLRDLLARASHDPLTRVSHVRLQPAAQDPAAATTASLEQRPVLTAAVHWLLAALCKAGLEIACEKIFSPSGDADTRAQRAAEADAALTTALASPEYRTDPLCLLSRRLNLTPIEVRLVILGLAPEMDVIFQRCFAKLQEDVGRRTGTLPVCSELLGDPVDVRRELTISGNLARWRLLDVRGMQALPAADEALRLDPPLIEWLLGDEGALEKDTRLRHVLRHGPWPGASLIEDVLDLRQIATHLQLLQQTVQPGRDGARWLLFNGDQTPTWYALLERSADLLSTAPLRVRCERLAALDGIEIGETAHRLTRLARLSHRPLLLDAARTEASAEQDEALRLLFLQVRAARCRAGVICTNVSRFIGLLGQEAARIVPDNCEPQLTRRRSLKVAAQRLGITLTDDLLQTLEQQFPLQADGWERAMQLTQARRVPTDGPAQLTPRFVAACRDVASETLSNLATRIQPHCDLRAVILPEERHLQLAQIVDSVRFARRVLDDWKFGEQLAYGRGVTALFHGPSGTGKTLSALAVAYELKRQVLRLDLSRVMSKYIGDTSKHFEALFRDAANCGAVMLVDEAEAVMGKRGEIKDAHDRYAVQEVAYLLQRIEEYDGVVIFTTNARQSIDPAFLRRLRFIIDFPRPDAAAREQIWKSCLPADRHELEPAAFRQLARKLDLTGGHISQITLQAAFLAASSNRKINLEDIASASRTELAKLGLPPVELGLPAARVEPKERAA